MEAIKTKFGDMSRFTTPTTGATSRRAYLLEQFLTGINTAQRVVDGYKPVTPARMGTMLAHMKDDDLYFFLRKCQAYKGPFSKCFFGSLKTKK